MSSTTTAPSKNESSTRPDEPLAQHPNLNPVDDFVEYVQEYARRRPDQAALWCFGIGFVVGWKLKPW